MIEGKVLKFGYGDICVGVNQPRFQISFQQFKPPAKCGETLENKNIEFIGEKIIITLSFEDSNSFCKLLKEVENKNITEFEFKEYTFDFSNYNSESIKVCRTKARQAIYLHMMCIAA